jgi:hypothetical protein
MQLFFVPLFFFQEKGIGVDAVENCALCSFPQRPHRLPPSDILE